MKIILFILVLFCVKNSISQEICGTDILHNKLLKDSNYKKSFNETTEKFNQILKNRRQEKADALKKKANALIENDDTKPYVIKLVIHVVHHGEPIGTGKNFSDAYIYSVIDEINNIFRNYYKNSVNMNIQFQLADKDPAGNPTNGINRINGSSIVNYNYGVINVEDAACSGKYGPSYSDIFLNYKWDQTKYYNIYCLETNTCVGWAGFAYYPTNSLNNSDYSFIANNAFTTDIIAHELGHALNLYHTFFDDGIGRTCPSSAPNEGDFCADTPPHRRDDCKTDICYLGLYNNDFYKSAYNYMSYCNVVQYLFTPNQSERTSAALFLESRVGLTTKIKRYNIVTINETLGSGKIRESVEVDSGTTNYVYVTPNGGFQLDSIFINNQPIPVTNQNSIIIRNINAHTTIRVKFGSKIFYINVQGANSNLSSLRDSLTYFQSSRINYNPINAGYKFDYISINGKKNIDSNRSFTFRNLEKDIQVFIKFIPINNVIFKNISNPIVKVNDTLKVSGSNINQLLLRKRNFKSYLKLSPITKIKIDDIDTMYNFLISPNIESNLYVVKGLGYDITDTSSNYRLIKTVEYNNLRPIGWGSNVHKQLDSLDKLKDIVQVSAGSFYALFLDRFGKVYKTGGGLTPPSLLTPPDDLSNVVEVKAGLGYQAMAILSDGSVRMWGARDDNKLTNNLTDIVDLAGLWDATLALDINGKLIGIGDANILQKYLSNGAYNNYNIAKIESGLYHFMVLTDNNLVLNFGDIQYYDRFNKFKPDRIDNIKNIFAKRYSSSAALKLDSTALVWGIDDSLIYNNPILQTNKFSQIGIGFKFFVGLLPNGNLIGIGDTLNQRLPIPTFLSNVKAISCGNDFTFALVDNPNPLIYTSVINGTISPSQFIVSGSTTTRITYNPTIGYKLDSVVVNGINIGVDSLTGYTFINQTYNQNIKVYFGIKKFNILIRYTANGTIIPNSNQVVNYGSDFELQIQANSSYIIDTFRINSRLIYFEDYINRLTYIFRNVRGDSSIYVTFKENNCLNAPNNTIIPTIIRRADLLISDRDFNKYLWYTNNNNLANLVTSTTVNEFRPEGVGVYSLKGQDNNKCNSMFSNKYYYSSTCIITSSGRLGNGIIIQNHIINEPEIIKISWCPDIIKNDLRIVAYSLEGYLIFNQIYNASSGKIIFNKNSIQAKNYFIQIIDNTTNELIQISDIIKKH